MNTTCTTNVDDISQLPIFHSEVRRCGSYELEGCSLVYGKHSLPLFVRHLWIKLVSSMHVRVYMSSSLAIARRRDLVDDPIPSEPRIIDNDMDLPTTKLRRFLHKIIDVFGI